jgi:hypothetical protein
MTIQTLLRSARIDQNAEEIKDIQEFMAEQELCFPVSNAEGHERIHSQHLTLKTLMEMDVRNQIKWKLGAAFNLMGRTPPIRCPCSSKSRITQSHLTRCLLYDRVWTLVAMDWNTYKQELIEYMETHIFASKYDLEERRKIHRFRRIAKQVNKLMAETL